MAIRLRLEIAASPTDEPPAQVGSPTYYTTALRECHVLIDQLRRMFGPEPLGAKLQIVWSQHDFGNYAEVACYFDPDFPDAVNYAFRCENECPARWDAAALASLSRKDS